MDVDIWWLAYPVLGAVVGFFAGLLGVGGGGIIGAILLVTDILGLTKVFPFTRSAR